MSRTAFDLIVLPYSLKFSRLKIFVVFAGCTLTTKILSREKFNTSILYVYVRMRYNLWAWQFVLAQTIAASAQRIESCWFLVLVLTLTLFLAIMSLLQYFK